MIGIITFHSAVNYGAVLQAYALQKKIEELGEKCNIIDYHCEAIDREYKLISKSDFFPVHLNKDYVRKLMMRFTLMKVRRDKNKKFGKFVKDNLSLSSVCNSMEDLKKLQDRYDAFITGSDQVWNPVLTGNDGAYFLEFADDKSKRYSYAASFGNMNKGFDLDDRFVKLLENFEGLSVREQSGEAYISEKINCKAEVHIDPTLTISEDKWNEMAKRPEEDKYLLVYTVCQPLHLLEKAKEIARKEGLKVIYLNDRVIHRDKEICYVPSASPEEFVGYFKYADYVMTNSFHGTVFSVIFKKHFMVEYESAGGRNKRIADLLALLDITDREIDDKEEINYKEDIDWSYADKRIATERKKSEDYLKKIIEAKNTN